MNYNETVTHGNDIEIGINNYGGGNLNVNAVHREAERTTTVNLEYNSKTGERITEVTDKSAPFDEAFYAALDAKMLKVAGAISNGEEEQA